MDAPQGTTFQEVWRDQDPHKALAWVLGRLMGRLPTAKEVSVADGHGLTVASTAPGGARREASAMGALITRSSREFFRGLGIQGEAHWIILEGEAATVLACRIPGGDESLILLLEPRADLPSAKVEVQRVVILVREVLDRM